MNNSSPLQRRSTSPPAGRTWRSRTSSSACAGRPAPAPFAGRQTATRWTSRFAKSNIFCISFQKKSKAALRTRRHGDHRLQALLRLREGRPGRQASRIQTYLFERFSFHFIFQLCSKPRGFDCVLIPGAVVGIPGGGVGGALKAEAFCGSGKGLAALGTQVGRDENHFGTWNNLIFTRAAKNCASCSSCLRGGKQFDINLWLSYAILFSHS